MPPKASPSTKQSKGKGKKIARQRTPAETASQHVVRVRTRMRGINPQIERIALAIALPVDHPGLRLPTVDAPRTAVCTVRDEYTLTGVNSTPPGFDTGDTLIAFFGRGALLAMVRGPASPLSATSIYFEPVIGTTPTTSWPFHLGLTSANRDFNAAWPLAGAVTTSPTVVGMPIGISKDSIGGYVFMNQNETLTLPAASFPVLGTITGSIRFSLYRFTSGQEPVMCNFGEATITVGVVGTVLITAPSDGWFGLHFASISVTTGSFNGPASCTVVLNSVSQFGWTPRSMADLDANLLGDVNLGTETRVNAQSLLLSNTSSVFNQQGEIQAARISRSEFYTVTQNILKNTTEKYVGKASNGLYTFTEFTQADEVFRKMTNGDFLLHDLDSPDPYHFIRITNAASATQPNSFAMIFDSTLEFKTQVARYARDISHGDYAALIAARSHINSNPVWFYENPLHMKDIYGFIKSVGKKVGGALHNYGPTAMKGLSVIDPAHAPFYAAAGGLMSHIGR